MGIFMKAHCTFESILSGLCVVSLVMHLHIEERCALTDTAEVLLFL